METGAKVAVGVGVAAVTGGIAWLLTQRPPVPPIGKPGVEIGLVWAEANPTFEPGSTHYAHVTIANPTDSGWYYAYEIYVGISAYVSRIYLAAGESRTDDHSFKMPMEAGTYPCYVDVRASETTHSYFYEYEHDLGRFDFDSVTIPELPPPPPDELIGNVRLLWKELMPLAPYIPHEYTLWFTNPSNEPLDYLYEVFIGGVSQGVGDVRALAGQTWDLPSVVSNLWPGTYTVWVTFYCVTYDVGLGQFDFPSIEVGFPAVPAAEVGWTWD